MVRIRGTTITMTRGDTLSVDVEIMQADGTKYILRDGDSVRFAMKRNYFDADPVLLKELDGTNPRIELLPEDTKDLEFGRYVYDVELTKEDGSVDTFIDRAVFNITEEVY